MYSIIILSVRLSIFIKLFLIQDGKYLIVKDPNKPILRLYDIPDNTFDSEDSEESSDDGEWSNYNHNNKYSERIVM